MQAPGRSGKVGLGLVTLSHQQPILTLDSQLSENWVSLQLYIDHKSRRLVWEPESTFGLVKLWVEANWARQSKQQKTNFDNWQPHCPANSIIYAPKTQNGKFWQSFGETSFSAQPFPYLGQQPVSHLTVWPTSIVFTEYHYFIPPECLLGHQWAIKQRKAQWENCLKGEKILYLPFWWTVPPGRCALH